jgi:hypothetical protein
MDTVTLFIDTNGFIQLRDLKDVKWRDLFPGVKRVRIMVARPVIEELDDFKSSTNARRRDRSRLALKLIDNASNETDRTLILKSRPVKVTLEIAPRARPDWNDLTELDPNSPDDRLVAAAITYGDGAAIFSHDSGPRISARDIGLKAYEPLDDWHLPAEQSDDQRKIGLLERQLKQALTTKPELEIEIEGRDTAGNLTLYRPKLKPLSAAVVDRLTRRYLQEHPRASIKPISVAFSTLMSGGGGISEDRVASYYEEYAAFEKRLKAFFEKLHETLPVYLAPPIVDVRIRNTGTVSAIDFHVGVHVSGGFKLVAHPDDIRKLCPYPPLPEKPKVRDPFRHVLAPHLGAINKPPHPTKINWIERPAFGSEFGSYGCADFRPKREYHDEIALWDDDPLPTTGEVTITAGANDIADISERFQVTLKEQPDKWYSSAVVESLPDFLQPELLALKPSRK